MKKYLYGFKLYFLDSFHYRFNTVVNLLFGNLSTLITIAFWIQIYKSSGTSIINGFTLSDTITYFVIGNIFRSCIFNSSGFQYSNMIKEGKLNSYLIKPYSISKSLYFINLSTSITSIFPQFVLLTVLMPAIAKYLSWNLTARNVTYLMIFLIISTISSHFTWSLLGMMAFWLEEANAVMWSFAVLLNLLTGMFIPLDYFPKRSIAIIEYLPFSSWGYVPMKIYLGHYDIQKMSILLVINICWIVFLYLMHKCIWSIGVKKYSSVGG